MRLIPLRFAGTCVECGTRLEPKTQAWYDDTTKKVTCAGCKPAVEGPPVAVPYLPAGSVLESSVSAADAPPVLLPPVELAPIDVPPTVARDRTPLEKGAELEQRIAQVLTANGYVTRTNVILEGRSGASHEIDVIGEKSDGLTTLNLAVECKAWERPIEKDVVFKFAAVLKDTGMREGIIVTLGGSRSGAEIAARDNGIELWGPDELEQHLGQLAVAALRTGPLRRESTGFPRRATSAEVESFLAGATRGRLGSAKEEIVWASDAWLPVAYLRIALSRMEGVLKKTMQTTRCWNTYELVTGEIIRAWDAEIAAEPVDLDAQQVTAKLKVNQPGRAIDEAVAKHRSVTSDAARERHGARVLGLGVPLGHQVVVESSTSVAYPVHVAIAQRRGSERLIVIDAFERRVHERLCRSLSPHAGWIRDSLSA